MAYEVGRVLIDRETIERRVGELGHELAADLQRELEAEGHGGAEHPDRVVLMPVLTGAMVFTADLIRKMDLMMSIGVVAVTSYAGETTVSKGARLRGALPPHIAGKHVVIIDDILDSGQTLALLQGLVTELKPASLRSCLMLRKDVERQVSVEADYIGFDIPDEFVVGYGLDFNGFYRNLPDIVALRETSG
jgi:hypoxanthine phosphoribosyltransferase